MGLGRNLSVARYKHFKLLLISTVCRVLWVGLLTFINFDISIVEAKKI